MNTVIVDFPYFSIFSGDTQLQPMEMPVYHKIRYDTADLHVELRKWVCKALERPGDKKLGY